MGDIMNKNKYIKPLFLGIITVTVLFVIGYTVSYFIWQGQNDTLVDLSVGGNLVQLDDGVDITGSNLIPVKSYNSPDSIKKDISIRLKNNPIENVSVTMSLKVNSIDDNLRVDSFKWTLVKDNSVVNEGNFSTDSDITLVTLNSSDNTLQTTLSEYTLYIWLDVNNVNETVMQNKSFDFSLIFSGDNSILERG